MVLQIYLAKAVEVMSGSGAISSAISSAFGAGFGALVAFSLARRRQAEDRVIAELGQCHILMFMLIHMAETMGNIDHQLFSQDKGPDGPRPWERIGALEGAPTQTMGFLLRDYAFLVDGSEERSDAASVLKDVHTAVVSYEANIAMIHSRNQLRNEYIAKRDSVPLMTGEHAIPHINAYKVLCARIKEQTDWLRQDLPNDISTLELLCERLGRVISTRFPRRKFLFPEKIVLDSSSSSDREPERDPGK